jgi:hypothetical protein
MMAGWVRFKKRYESVSGTSGPFGLVNRTENILSLPEPLAVKQQLQPQTILLVALYALLSFTFAAIVALGAFEAMPHLEDEHANLFQAKVFARGLVTAPLPPVPGAYRVEFVVSAYGHRFSKYPPGYSLLLALGVLIRLPWIINALAAALGLLGTFMVARELFGQKAGLWAMFLGLFSPSYILLSGSLLAHSTNLAAIIWFVWALLSLRRGQPRRPEVLAVVAGGLAGLAFIIRPWTAIALELPFLCLLIRDAILQPRIALRRYWPLVLSFLLLASLFPLYIYLATGSPFTNLYRLWWPFDTIGWGPTIGTKGFTWIISMVNLFTDWPAFFKTVVGWPNVVGVSLAWFGILLGLLWPPRRWRHLWLVIPPLCLVIAYLAYWALGEGLFGARYYAEAMPFVWILIARGLDKLSTRKVWLWGVPLLVALLTVLGSYSVTWPRIQRARGFYGISRAREDEIKTAQLHHALVFVTLRQWPDYASLSWMNKPVLAESDVIYVIDRGMEVNLRTIEAFPDRPVFYYDHSREPSITHSPPDP